MIDIQEPPANWIAPAPPGIELRLSLSEVNSICRLLRAEVPSGKEVYCCSIRDNGGCLIVVPKIDFGFDLADQDKVQVHETAHCNGWPADHPRM